MRFLQDENPTVTGRESPAESGPKARPTFRFAVALPLACALLTGFSAWGAMILTRRLFSGGAPWGEPALYLWVLGSPLIAWLLGAGLARCVTRPLQRILRKGQAALRRARIAPAPVQATHEVGALSALMDQLLGSFGGLVQAREVLDSLREAVLVLDGEGRVAGMNRRGQELLGLALADASSRPLATLLPPGKSDGILWSVAREVLERGEARAQDGVPFRLPSGQEVLLSVTGTPLRWTGNGHGAVLVLKVRVQIWDEHPEILGRNGRRMARLDRTGPWRPRSQGS